MERAWSSLQTRQSETPEVRSGSLVWDMYLLSLVESFAVTVGQVHSTGHHAWTGFELLQGSFHVSAAGALWRQEG